MRRFPASDLNIFQQVYSLIDSSRDSFGEPALNLALGNPDGVPPEAIRELQARFAADPAHRYHTYAEQRNLNGFAEGMVELHGRIRVSDHAHLAALPIPGIKTASALIPLACGLHLPDRSARKDFLVVSNQPAYDVIGTWSECYLGAARVAWPLSSADGMRLNLDLLKSALKDRDAGRPDIIFVIRPGNPGAVRGRAEEWEPLIEYCAAHKTRLVNDAAYAGLADENHVPLASAAKDHPELEWAELYSVSKSFSDPGARLGAIVGSKDFIADMAMIKGNTDSGPCPSVMSAYGEFFKDLPAARKSMRELWHLYRKRLDYVIGRFTAAGLQSACTAEAGLFTLWKVPKKILGVTLADHAASSGTQVHEVFNRLVAEKTGLVGLHFQGTEPLIRYGVCADVLEAAFSRRFEEQLARLKPEY